MKLHEIEWVDGNEYKVAVDGKHEVKVRVKGSVLVFIDDEQTSVTDTFKLKYLLNAEFTPIDKPVTFLEAYQDCEKNGTTYADKHNICTVRRDSNGKVELKVRNTVVDYTVVCVGRMEFTKVVD